MPPTKRQQTPQTNPPSKTSDVDKYKLSLTDQEKKTLEIAQDHLGSSFNINRSIGFLNWKEKQQ